MNLAQRLESSAQKAPGHPAIVFRDREIPYRALDEEANRMAAGLTHLGVDVGDRVALWLPNHPAFVSALYGCWRAGAIAVPVNPVLTWREARHILEDSGSSVVFCADPHYSQVAERIRAEVPTVDQVITLGGEARAGDLTVAQLLESGTGAFPPAELEDDHLALIAYTSGTSGAPKGAMLSHRNLGANLDQMLATPLAPTASDVALCVLPLFHIFGLNVVLNLSIATGATVVVVERFDASASLRTIRQRRVSVLAAAPSAYVAWLHLPEATAEDFATVRVAVSGAAPLPAEVLKGFRERFGITIWEGYGMTETAPAVTFTAVGGEAKPGSIGRPLPGVEVRLVGEDGEDAEPGDPGEVVVRGPNVFRGYWQQPEASAEVLRGGWFYTGDVAVADESGDLYIVDRKRDLILVSGFNVYPREVEEVLGSHSRVADCAVVGVPDPHTGEQVKAFVQPRDEALTEEELVAYCRSRLAPFKIPRSIEFVEAIPRNAAGKVLRRELR